ncbi:MAG TPA: cell division protein FtsZ [Xanthobacteraceae bacterium]|nr:cell division protein FtsZ [Xanthobacteraceae bacterium]
MTINLNIPDIHELKPRITVFGVGGAGGNAVNNMITAGLQGVDFVVANTDAQALTSSKAERIVQMGVQVTQGLGAGSAPEVGRAAAEEVLDEIRDHLSGVNMVFVTAGMGGGTGTGAAPVIAKAAREAGILTVGVVTKPFHFEGQRRMRIAENGITELHKSVDTLLIIPNQNLFRVANEKTTFADAFAMADQVLYSGVACITDLMVKEGLINLDFADVRMVMREMGKAMMGTGEAEGDKRALTAAEAAISNPLIDDASMKGARGLLISITGGRDLKLYEVDEAATRIREEVDQDANIIVGATFDESLDGIIRVSVVATGIDQAVAAQRTVPAPNLAAAGARITEIAEGLRKENQHILDRIERSEQPRTIMQPLRAATPAPAAPVAAAAPASINASIESAARVAIESAVQDVNIRPLSLNPSLLLQPAPSSTEEAQDTGDFIPPQAERAPVRAPRMPRLEELPIPAQNEIRAWRGELPQEEHPGRRKSLLERLASVGLGRREQVKEEEAPPAPAQRMMQPAPAMERLPGRPMMPRPAEPRPEPVSEYAKRSAPQGLDQHGRQAPVHNKEEQDQLEIPAFLRRQAH